MSPRLLLLPVVVSTILLPVMRGQSSADDLGEPLEAIRRQYNLPGLLGLALKGGRIAGQGAAGVRQAGDYTRLGVDDPINIGSCTKWMTATLAGRLVDRGVIEWRTRVREVFPNWMSFNSAFWDVTLEELLAHRGGVPEAAVWEPRHRPALFTLNGTAAQLRRWVADVTLAGAPQVARGTELYSNQGYAVAAAMLELRAGASWETLMAEEVFVPLGMKSARIGSCYDGFGTPAPAAVGHDQANPGAASVPRVALTGQDLIRYQAMAGPGGMVVCSLRDWARFLQRHAADGEGYLAPATARKLRTPFVGETGYALGVNVLTRGFAEPDKALSHTGDILGQTSVFWIAPATDLVLLVYTNTAARGSASAEGRDAAAGMMLARYRDAPPSGPYLEPLDATPPSIRTHPAAVAARPGEAVVLEVDADGGPPLSYQWRFNDVPIPGATSPRLTISAAAAEHVGFYSVEIGNGEGVASSAAARLTLAGEAATNRLCNLSVLARVGVAPRVTVGFTLSEGTTPVLVRAVGPGLRSVGVSTPLENPAMTLRSRSALPLANDDWVPGAAISSATTAVGAFPLAGGSLDAALLRTLESGPGTIEVERSAAARAAQPGLVLVEVYDAGTGTTGRLGNLSVLHEIASAEDALTAGFTLAGAGERRLLIRAVGPGLRPLGIDAVAADPRLQLHDSEGMLLWENDDWGAETLPAFGAVGAFPLAVNSRDAALVVSLRPGGYSARVSSATGAAGQVLLEIYELP